MHNEIRERRTDIINCLFIVRLVSKSKPHEKWKLQQHLISFGSTSVRNWRIHEGEISDGKRNREKRRNVKIRNTVCRRTRSGSAGELYTDHVNTNSSSAHGYVTYVQCTQVLGMEEVQSKIVAIAETFWPFSGSDLCTTKILLCFKAEYFGFISFFDFISFRTKHVNQMNEPIHSNAPICTMLCSWILILKVFSIYTLSVRAADHHKYQASTILFVMNSNLNFPSKPPLCAEWLGFFINFY